MSDLVNTLRRELTELETALRDDPRFVKIQRIKELLAVYEKDAEPSSSLPLKLAEQPKTAKGNGRPGSKAEEIKAAVRGLLSSSAKVHRKEMLKRLTEMKLMGHEKNPMGQLAAYLSEWRADFTSDGLGNFSLVRREPSATGEQTDRRH